MTDKSWGIWFEAIYNYTCPHCLKWISVSTIKPKSVAELVCIHCKQISTIPEIWKTCDEKGLNWELSDIQMIDPRQVSD